MNFNSITIENVLSREKIYVPSPIAEGRMKGSELRKLKIRKLKIPIFWKFQRIANVRNWNFQCYNSNEKFLKVSENYISHCWLTKSSANPSGYSLFHKWLYSHLHIASTLNFRKIGNIKRIQCSIFIVP